MSGFIIIRKFNFTVTIINNISYKYLTKKGIVNRKSVFLIKTIVFWIKKIVFLIKKLYNAKVDFKSVFIVYKPVYLKIGF